MLQCLLYLYLLYQIHFDFSFYCNRKKICYYKKNATIAEKLFFLLDNAESHKKLRLISLHLPRLIQFFEVFFEDHTCFEIQSSSIMIKILFCKFGVWETTEEICASANRTYELFDIILLDLIFHGRIENSINLERFIKSFAEFNRLVRVAF